MKPLCLLFVSITKPSIMAPFCINIQGFAELNSHLKTSVAEGNNKLVLIDVYTQWCGPCKRMIKPLEELAEQNAARLTVLKVDIEAEGNDELVSYFNIRAFPSFLLFANGKMDPVDRCTGASREKIEAMIAKALTVVPVASSIVATETTAPALDSTPTVI